MKTTYTKWHKASYEKRKEKISEHDKLMRKVFKEFCNKSKCSVNKNKA